MNINNFQPKKEETKKMLEKKLEAFKLEKVLSLWYFVQSSGKGTVAGSKN